MRTGICPKCGSHQVYSSRRGSNSACCSSSTIPMSPRAAFLPDYMQLAEYVCAVCGYAESYVADPNALRQIVNTWDHIYPTLYK